jgi:hypothetical protein
VSTFRFIASIIGFALLTLAILAGLAYAFAPAFPGPLLWIAVTPGALLLGLTTTAALDDPIGL